MKTPVYQPPRQSRFGQLIDAVFLLLLVLASLFGPLWLGLAGGGKTALEFKEKTWEAIGQNPTMQAQWEKLGFTPESAADMIAARFDYSFDIVALAITAVVVIGYFVFVVKLSDREYRDVIAERFDA